MKKETKDQSSKHPNRAGDFRVNVAGIAQIFDGYRWVNATLDEFKITTQEFWLLKDGLSEQKTYHRKQIEKIEELEVKLGKYKPVLIIDA